MVVSDPVADFITRVKNSADVGKKTVSFPYSDFKMRLSELLKKEGYFTGVSKKGKKVQKTIEAEIAYVDGSPKVQGVRRISKLSRRVYNGADDIQPVKSGHGQVVLSTPEGVMTGEMARKKGIGGEVLFEIW